MPNILPSLSLAPPLPSSLPLAGLAGWGLHGHRLVAVGVVETSGSLAGWGQLGARAMGGGWLGGAASSSFWKALPLCHAPCSAQERVQGAWGLWLGETGTPTQKKWVETVESHVSKIPPGSSSHCAPKVQAPGRPHHFNAGQTKMVVKAL